MSLEISLDADADWDSSSPWQEVIAAAAQAALAESGFASLGTSRQCEISVCLAGDTEVQRLNREWRGKDRPTNVLSFPMVEAADLASATVAAPELLLGDIILASGVCRREAAEKGVALESHVAHLIVHGTLHLLGFDHGDDTAAADMERREVLALARLGIDNPYEVTA
jgi:probable rRNA maturation factor